MSPVLRPAPESPSHLDEQRRKRNRRHLVWLVFGAAWGWLMRDLTGE